MRDNLVRVFEDKRYDYDGHGRLTEKRSGRHTVQRFAWDDEHRLIAVHTTRASPQARAKRKAAKADGPAQTTQTTTFEYDALGRRVAKVDTFGRTEFIWEGLRLIEERRGSSVVSYVYEPGSYQYDPAGNLLQIDDARSGTTRYTYDKLGRLTGARQPALAERFAFDPAHNLVPPQPRAGQAGSTGLIRDNRLEVFEDKRYAWDAHGNLLEKRIGRHTTIEFCWDVEHQLTRALVTRRGITRQIDYAYDAFGRRIAKREGDSQTHFTWDGNRLLAEQRGNTQTLYLYEAESFAPLAQLVGGAAGGDAAGKDKPAAAPPPDDDDLDDWQPGKTRVALSLPAGRPAFCDHGELRRRVPLGGCGPWPDEPAARRARR